MSEAFTGPTLTDLSTDAAQVQARYELNRALDTVAMKATDTKALALWAWKWGEQALDALAAGEGSEALDDRITKAERVLEKAIKRMEGLCKVYDARDDIRDALEGFTGELETLRDEISDL